MAKKGQPGEGGRVFMGAIFYGGQFNSQLSTPAGYYTFPTFAECQKAAEAYVTRTGGQYQVYIMSSIAVVETEKSPVVVRPIGAATLAPTAEEVASA